MIVPMAFAQEITAKIKYIYAGKHRTRTYVEDYYQPYLEVYSENKKIFSKNMLFNNGYYIDRNYLIIFIDKQNIANNNGEHIVSATIYVYKDNTLKKINENINSDEYYKINCCMTKSLFKDRIICEQIGKDFIKKICILEKLYDNYDFIGLAKRYAIMKNLPRNGKNSQWTDQRIVGNFASIIYEHDVTLSASDYESIIRMIYIFKNINGRWTVIHYLNISAGIPWRMSNLKNKIPGITPEIINKLGLPYNK